MKKLIAICFAALSSWALGATISVGGAPAGRLGVQSAEGGALLTGANSYYITVGSYTSAPVPPTDLASFQAVISNFVALTDASSAVVTLGSAADGLIAGSFVGTGPASLSSDPIYIFISNTANYTQATQLAVLRASTQLFPDPIGGAGSVAVTNSVTGLVQIVGPVTDTAASRDFVTMVQVIPEPSIALLGMLGLFGLARRRR